MPYITRTRNITLCTGPTEFPKHLDNSVHFIVLLTFDFLP